MNTEHSWHIVLVATLATALCKTSGFWFRERALPVSVLRVLPVLAPALLAAMVINASFASASGWQIDARIAGLLVALVALHKRVPLLLVMALAAVTTALLRAW